MPEEKIISSVSKSDAIVRQKLSDQVFDRLRDMVVSGELAPGDAMPSERELMDRFSVGRPAVREALQSMANKGLITISHGERSRVNELNLDLALNQLDDIAKLLLNAEPANLEHLKQVRRILETGTIKIAAQQATAEDVAELRALIEEQRQHIGDTQAFIQADVDFHMKVAEVAENPLLRAVTYAMMNWLLEYYRPLLYLSGREEITLLEHGRIVDFLERNDVQGAERMLIDHLNRSNPLYTTQKTSGDSTKEKQSKK